MLASAALGKTYTPEDLFRDFPDIEKYRDDYGGFGDGLFKDKKILEKLGLVYEDTYWYGKAWSEGLLMESLEEGKRAIWNTQNSLFTNTGHYIELELKDGKLWLNDPNGANYKSTNPILKDILENGITPEDFKKYGGRFYIFDTADSGATEKSDEAILNEILGKRTTTGTSEDLSEKALEDLGTDTARKEHTLIENQDTSARTTKKFSLYNWTRHIRKNN